MIITVLLYLLYIRVHVLSEIINKLEFLVIFDEFHIFNYNNIYNKLFYWHK